MSPRNTNLNFEFELFNLADSMIKLWLLLAKDYRWAHNPKSSNLSKTLIEQIKPKVSPWL